MLPGYPQAVGCKDACVAVRVCGFEERFGGAPEMALYGYVGLERRREVFQEIDLDVV